MKNRIAYFVFCCAFVGCSNETPEPTSQPELPVIAEEAPSDAIDLGLSVLWADKNLGANSAEQSGNYYAWGETKTKYNFDWNTYLLPLGQMKTFSDCGTYKDPLAEYVSGGEKYHVATKAGEADGIGQTEFDAAKVSLGKKWRLPTDKEIRELVNNCIWTWITQNGVNGYLVKSKTNNNSIFFPAAGCKYGSSLILDRTDGYYWSSTPYFAGVDCAFVLEFKTYEYKWNSHRRYNGMPIRPVYDKP